MIHKINKYCIYDGCETYAGYNFPVHNLNNISDKI